jgi:EAL domain-containing protein (putative c-di-GMP-specific phosphodiesterase class I)
VTDFAVQSQVFPEFATPSLRPFASRFQRAQGLYEASYKDLVVRSAFQPIFSFAHARPVGFEGLARASDATGNSVSPMTLLEGERSIEGTVYLDRLLRALHLSNFVTHPFENAWLFLNVSPSVVINGRTQGPFFKELLQAWKMPPQRVVVEVTESETSDEGVLEEAAAYYKDIGCLLAIDDFGAGHSNFQRIWRLRPDIIKLDRMMVNHAARDPAGRRGLVGLAGLLHEIGALVLAEGIETEQEALAVLHAEVDLLQGYYVQRPFIGPPPPMESRGRFDALRRSLMQEVKSEEADFSAGIEPYIQAFAQAADRMAAGEDFAAALRPLLELPSAIRAYALDAGGSQIGENLTAADHVARRDPRHEPLVNACGANWMHRHYFRRALSNPDRVQVSRPYLSLTDPRMCLTLSRVSRQRDAAIVLCCDVDYPIVP